MRTLLIVDNNMKEKVLELINMEDKLINIKIMTNQDFLNHYFFDYDKKAIYYLKNKYNLTPSNAKVYLDNIKYVIESNSKDEKVLLLKEMYNYLLDNNLLIIDNYFKEYLKTIKIKVLITSKLDKFTKNIYDKINASYINFNLDEYTNNNPIYHFKTIDEEVEYVFNRISLLIKDNISLNNIKIISLGSEYNNYLNRFSKLYHINLNNLTKESLYGTIAVNKVIKMIKEKSKEEINTYLNSKHDDVYNTIFNILNKYYFVDDLNLVLDMIKEDFKESSIKRTVYKEAIEIINLNSYLIDKKDFVFILGFNLENIPKTYKDIDFLNDNLKQQLGLFTSLELNLKEREEVTYHLNHISNLTITYKDIDPYNTFNKNNLEIKEIIDAPSIPNETSNLYNEIKLASNLDLMLKYGTKEGDTNILFNTYPDIPYLKYDNKFKGIDYEDNKIILSYTSLNNFYHCKFRYYIDNILKLNIYEESFKTYIGSLFHYVLSKMFNDNFDFNLEFNNYIKDKEFSKKERFYLEILKEELKKIIEVIKVQHNISGFNDLKLEQEIKLNYNDDVFKGFIDKIMYKEKNNQTYISVIDYKTGTPKLDMTNAIYGIDMQLPIYAYLIKKSNLFLNPKIVGFYFEQIMSNIPTFDKKLSLDEVRYNNLKLQGYTIDDMEIVPVFDSTYEDSKLIKSMKVSSKGFYGYTKVLSEDAIDKLVEIVDLRIKEAFTEIKSGNFQIDPKVIGGNMVGCLYCKYQDLCFKTGNDYKYLKKQDFSYLGGCDGEVDS